MIRARPRHSTGYASAPVLGSSVGDPKKPPDGGVVTSALSAEAGFADEPWDETDLVTV